jgi:hypothetical protein
VELSKTEVKALLSKLRGEEQRLLHLYEHNESRYEALKGNSKHRVERSQKRDLANKDYDSLESIREIMSSFCNAIEIAYEDKRINDLSPDLI